VFFFAEWRALNAEAGPARPFAAAPTILVATFRNEENVSGAKTVDAPKTQNLRFAWFCFVCRSEFEK
jgi:hypothetical protein